ncbi:MAG: phytanoyl-CoA dioxygenase family protein [Nannocystaceae bacterium]
MLTLQQRRRYATDGYLVLPELIPPAELRAARAAALRIVDDFDLEAHRTVFTTRDRDAGRDEAFFASAQRVHCFLEEDALDEHGELRQPPRLSINKIGHAMHDLVPAFGELCRRPELLATLRELGVADPRVWQTMYIFKQPRIGGEVRWHQDASYLITRPASVVGVWIAIEDAHQDNGCLRVQPGGHRSPLREIYEVDWERREGTLRSLDPAPWPTAADTVPLEVPAGSVVVFHDHLPHASEPNRSEHSRHAFTMHVAPRDVTWSSRNWLQRPQLGDFAL